MSSRIWATKASRRAFITGSTGVAALSVLKINGSAFAQAESPLTTRAIPHSNEQLPVIGLGTANNFQAQPQGAEKATLRKVVDDLLAQGCKLIDTASSYGGAESLLGELLSDQDRSKVFLWTKIEDGSSKGGLSEFRNSLERLRYRQVDLLQQHNIQDPHQDLATFRDWKTQGLAATSALPQPTRMTTMPPRRSSAERNPISFRSTIRWPIAQPRSVYYPPRRMLARPY
jgi:hypothetical protein